MNNLEYLNGTIIEAFDKELAKITMNNPDIDWAAKEKEEGDTK
jgi:hypothetical protein